MNPILWSNINRLTSGRNCCVNVQNIFVGFFFFGLGGGEGNSYLSTMPVCLVQSTSIFTSSVTEPFDGAFKFSLINVGLKSFPLTSKKT